MKDQGRAKGFPVKIWCKTRCIFCALHLISVWSSCSNNTVAVVQYTCGQKYSYSGHNNWQWVGFILKVFVSDISLLLILGLTKVIVVQIIHLFFHVGICLFWWSTFVCSCTSLRRESNAYMAKLMSVIMDFHFCVRGLTRQKMPPHFSRINTFTACPMEIKTWPHMDFFE